MSVFLSRPASPIALGLALVVVGCSAGFGDDLTGGPAASAGSGGIAGTMGGSGGAGQGGPAGGAGQTGKSGGGGASGGSAGNSGGGGASAAAGTSSAGSAGASAGAGGALSSGGTSGSGGSNAAGTGGGGGPAEGGAAGTGVAAGTSGASGASSGSSGAAGATGGASGAGANGGAGGKSGGAGGSTSGAGGAIGGAGGSTSGAGGSASGAGGTKGGAGGAIVAPVCGDGVVEPGEQCDVGAEKNEHCVGCQIVCSGGSESYGGHCYTFRQTQRTFANARTSCAAGEHLATITTSGEHTFLAKLVKDNTNIIMEGAWMGLTDSANEGTFVWITDEPFAFEKWAIGEPNDQQFNGGEDCGMILRNGGWNDAACNRSLPFVCELDGPSSP